MLVRQALAKEIPYLNERLRESEGEQVDLSRVWVAVEDEKIIGMIAARMVWQLEPLLIFPEVENKITRSRATYKLFAAAQQWLGDRSLNKTGIYWFFGVSRSLEIRKWAKRIGLYRQYIGADTYIKHL